MGERWISVCRLPDSLSLLFVDLNPIVAVLRKQSTWSVRYSTGWQVGETEWVGKR